MKSSSLQLFAMALIAGAGLAAGGSASAQGTFTPGTGTSANCNPTAVVDGVAGAAIRDSYTCGPIGTESVSVGMTTWGFTKQKTDGTTALNATAQTGFTQGRLADFDAYGFGAYTGNKERSSDGLSSNSVYDGQHAFDNVSSGCGSASSPGIGGSVTLSANNSGCGGSIEALFLDFGSKGQPHERGHRLEELGC
ncbi:MAG: hypothetical protein IPF94_12415 [Betaproteobacteria bacterium]|nr:hypothetical protein [Betaproteobacteria bacterium]